MMYLSISLDLTLFPIGLSCFFRKNVRVHQIHISRNVFNYLKLITCTKKSSKIIKTLAIIYESESSIVSLYYTIISHKYFSILSRSSPTPTLLSSSHFYFIWKIMSRIFLNIYYYKNVNSLWWIIWIDSIHQSKLIRFNCLVQWMPQSDRSPPSPHLKKKKNWGKN